MALADDFRVLVADLPDDWGDASFLVRFPDEQTAAQAAAALGSINAGRFRDTVRFHAARRGSPSPDAVARALRRVDARGLRGAIEVAGSERAADVPAVARHSLLDEWEDAVASLPPDWSDLHAEVELTSTDHLERGALLLSPLNPSRHGTRPVLRFRCARSFGYGAAPEMVRRCLVRLDEAEIRGTVRILRALSDTRPWATQGPVWYVEGKSV